MAEENNYSKEEVLSRINSDDPDLRRQAIEEFFNREMDEEILRNICNRINDSDQGVRDAVNNVLMLSDNPKIPSYLVSLVSDKEIIVRNLAGEILLKKGFASVNALVEYLLKSDNVDDQKFIIDILGLIGDTSVEDIIIDVLRNSTNENVVLSCLEAFGNLSSENAFSFLSEYYEKNELYKPTIIEAMGKISKPEALEFMIKKYETEDPLTKYAICDCVGQIGNEDTFFLLLSELKKHEPPMTWAIVHSLWLLKEKYDMDIPFDETTKLAILNAIAGAENEYKKAAISLLKNFIDGEVFRTFLKIYGDDYLIDEEILSSLSRNVNLFISELIEYLNNTPKNLRSVLELFRQVLDMFGSEMLNEVEQISKHKLCEKLSVFLTNPDEEVRRMVMEYLFLINADIAMIFVDTMTSDTNVWNKLRLIELLEFVGNSDALHALELLSKDEEEMIQERATQVLSSINPKPDEE